MEYNTTGRRRVARKPHPACGGFCPRIQPGDVYWETVAFPGAEFVDTDKPVRMHVCARCALRHGDDLDVPYEQCARQGLL